MNRNRVPRSTAPIVAFVVVALSAGGIGIAHGSFHSSDLAAKAAEGKKKPHTIDADWKTGPLDIISEGEFGADFEGTDEAKLRGRPFAKKALLDERFLFTFNHHGEMPRMDYSGTYHVTFDADVFLRARVIGSFKGFYDYSVDAEGNPVAAPSGEITGGNREFKGASGSFTVLDFHTTSHDPVKYAGRWKGSVRY